MSKVYSQEHLEQIAIDLESTLTDLPTETASPYVLSWLEDIYFAGVKYGHDESYSIPSKITDTEERYKYLKDKIKAEREDKQEPKPKQVDLIDAEGNYVLF